jgi:hypothetical protein
VSRAAVDTRAQLARSLSFLPTEALIEFADEHGRTVELLTVPDEHSSQRGHSRPVPTG